MHVQDAQLKQFLLDAGLVSRAQCEAVFKKTGEGGGLAQALVSAGAISEDDARRAAAAVLGVPFINLGRERIDRDILRLIPEPIARMHNIVAFKRDDAALYVALLDMDDLAAIDFIAKKTHLKLLPRLTDGESMRSVLLQYQKSLKTEFGDIIAREAQSLHIIAEADAELSEEDVKRAAEEIPTVRIVDMLLRHALIQGASDIHIEPQEKDLLVRYRIDGVLRDAMALPKAVTSGLTARIKVLSSMPLAKASLLQDGRFKVEHEGERISFRVSMLQVVHGEKILIHLLPEGRKGLTLGSLGFHGAPLETLHSAMKKNEGMILVAGPSGSGKTTVLYAMLEMLNAPRLSISTIEDPVERQMPRINQTQVRPEIGLSYPQGLRALLRQDPDVVGVGEIRDGDTASLAIDAALRGHLLLSTVRTSSASSALTKLLAIGAEPLLLISALHIVIGQRLVRRLCSSKETYKPSQADLEELSKIANMPRVLEALKEEKIIEKKATWKDISFFKPNACAECQDGYRGTIGLQETLPMSGGIKALVERGTSPEEIEKQARTEGMLTLVEDGIFKAVQGLTSIEEVYTLAGE